MTEKEKRDLGLIYDANHDTELYREVIRAKELCYDYNLTRPSDEENKQEILDKLLGRKGEETTILAPFWCDYGYNIFLGDHVFINHNCVILDGARVTVGDYVFIGPDCGFYTAEHPMDVSKRAAGLEHAQPIIVGNHVWIGGGVKLLPGVTVGDGSVIGAGSVVTEDIPAGVVAAGNPCRVIRKLSDQEVRLSLVTKGNPRKPEGEAGAKMLAGMNENHAPVTEWALEFLKKEGVQTILDIGCGGGATLGRLSSIFPEAQLTGLDYSPVSVAETKRYNADLIDRSRLEVVEASVEDMPFADSSFDRITTVESFYFWPDPAENLKEVVRILKPGGQFLLIADIYGKAGLSEVTLANIEQFDLFNPSKEEFIMMFRNAGFTAVRAHLEEGTDWICVEGLL